MKVYVWEEIDELTTNYHSGGGLVVFADSLDRAMELAEAKGVKFHESEAPDDFREVVGGDEAVYIMPDAGCC